MLGVYIHIPFCISKCHYCDFNSHSNKDNLVDRYISALKDEVSMYGEELRDVRTVFIGGGTPTCIDSGHIVEVMNELYKYADRNLIEEITIEGNPKTFTEDKLIDYVSSGINRLSIGVQSLDDEMLNRIGRAHDRADVYSTLSLVKRHIENVNLDIIFGLPDQTEENLVDTLNQAVNLGVNHISFYALKLEEGTVFYREESEGRLNLPDEEAERRMYHLGKAILEESGYMQYEISNFAKRGFESKHNLIYWNVDPYIGLGLSAASNLDGLRYSNVDSFEDYFEMVQRHEKPIAKETIEAIDRDMEIAEYSMLRLRLNEGIVKSDFKLRFGVDIGDVYGAAIDKYLKRELLQEDGDRICLTELGLDLSNQVFSELLP